GGGGGGGGGPGGGGRSRPPPVASGLAVASRRLRYSGVRPASDSVMHRAVVGPMPGSSGSVSARARSSSSSMDSKAARAAAVRNARTRYVGSRARSSRNAIRRRSATGSCGMAHNVTAVKPGHDERTIRRIEQAAGGLATQAVARMDEELPWFRTLPADQRSWVMLVAQAGIASFVEWMRSPDDVLRLTGEVFAAAPQAMARAV